VARPSARLTQRLTRPPVPWPTRSQRAGRPPPKRSVSSHRHLVCDWRDEPGRRLHLL